MPPSNPRVILFGVEQLCLAYITDCTHARSSGTPPVRVILTPYKWFPINVK